MSDTPQWAIERPNQWLDHSQLELHNKLRNGAEVAAYVNLAGYIDMETQTDRGVHGAVAIQTDKVMAFSVGEWRAFVSAVEAAITEDERYRDMLHAVGNIDPSGQTAPTYEQLQSVFEAHGYDGQGRFR